MEFLTAAITRFVVGKVLRAHTWWDWHFDVGTSALRILALAFQKFVAAINITFGVAIGDSHLVCLGMCLWNFPRAEVRISSLAVLIHDDVGNRFLELSDGHVALVITGHAAHHF